MIPRDLSGILAERCSECSLALNEYGRVRAGLIAFPSRREGGCTIFRTGCLVMRLSQLNGKTMKDGVAWLGCRPRLAYGKVMRFSRNSSETDQAENIIDPNSFGYNLKAGRLSLDTTDFVFSACGIIPFLDVFFISLNPR